MTSNWWQGRAAYVAMSVFLVWHTLALMVSPIPDSSLKDALNGVLHPYLTLLRLDNTWGFYAPEVETGQELRYTVEDGEGKEHEFRPIEQFGWFHPAFWWVRSWHHTIIDSPDDFAETAGRLLCKKHASLHPKSVALIHILPEEFSVEDYLAGKNPLDPEFVSVNEFKKVQCGGL
jgi:hypothetical protein